MNNFCFSVDLGVGRPARAVSSGRPPLARPSEGLLVTGPALQAAPLPRRSAAVALLVPAQPLGALPVLGHLSEQVAGLLAAGATAC